MVELKKLIDSAVHFGHKTTYWNPRMEPYIWGQKNKVHLIDISKTAFLLEKAAEFLKNVAAENKTIVWVGTKKAARDIIKKIGLELNQPYITHRWIGGTLTNYSQIKKSITKLLHYEDILSKSEQFSYTKKELNRLQKIVNRLRENVGGISTMRWPVGALVVVDVRKEHAAVKEANVVGVPVVALVDTNSDPSIVDYVIPGNDDAPQSINLVMDYLFEGVKAGIEEAKVKQQEAIASETQVTEEIQILPLVEEEAEQTPGKKAEAKAAKLKKFKETAKKPEGAKKRDK